MTSLSSLWFLSLVVATTLGCENNKADLSKAKTVAWPKQDAKDEGDGYWKKLDAGPNDFAGNGKFKNRFWLNFAGATVTKEQSFIVDRSGANQVIPAFSAADVGAQTDLEALKSTLLATVKSHFQGVDVEVSLEEPKTKPFSTVFVGGKNFTGRPNVLGVAPLDAGNWSGEDLVFVFAQEFIGRPAGEALILLSQTIVHEMAHSMGARHIINDKAVMNAIVAPTANDLDISGKLTEGEGSENSKEILVTNVGKVSSVVTTVAGLPLISDLDIRSDGDVGQFSVLTLENVKNNTGIQLPDFNYSWSLAGLTVSGPLIRIRFRDNQPKVLTLVVTNDNNESKTFQFSVAKGNQ